jgi:hypothetical protein
VNPGTYQREITREKRQETENPDRETLYSASEERHNNLQRTQQAIAGKEENPLNL